MARRVTRKITMKLELVFNKIAIMLPQLNPHIFNSIKIKMKRLVKTHIRKKRKKVLKTNKMMTTVMKKKVTVIQPLATTKKVVMPKMKLRKMLKKRMLLPHQVQETKNRTKLVVVISLHTLHIEVEEITEEEVTIEVEVISEVPEDSEVITEETTEVAEETSVSKEEATLTDTHLDSNLTKMPLMIRLKVVMKVTLFLVAMIKTRDLKYQEEDTVATTEETVVAEASTRAEMTNYKKELPKEVTTLSTEIKLMIIEEEVVVADTTTKNMTDKKVETSKKISKM